MVDEIVFAGLVAIYIVVGMFTTIIVGCIISPTFRKSFLEDMKRP